MLIPFKEPPVGPTNEDEEDTFTEFEGLLSLGVLSLMVGWAIQQGKNITSQEGKQEVVELKDSIREVFQGRCCHNWGLLLFL